MDLFLPTGQRYCVNSSSLDFVPEIDEADGKVKVEETEYIKHEATLGGKCINSLINNKLTPYLSALDFRILDFGVYFKLGKKSSSKPT